MSRMRRMPVGKEIALAVLPDDVAGVDRPRMPRSIGSLQGPAIASGGVVDDEIAEVSIPRDHGVGMNGM